MMDCNAAAVLAAFQGDTARCQLVVACEQRYISADVTIPPDVKAACDKVLADWKATKSSLAAGHQKQNDDAIRKLMK